MRVLCKVLHLIGLTMFLGSIWVYIAQGTPLETPLITSYVRDSVWQLVRTLTIPGLALTIVSGMSLACLQRRPFTSPFVRTKLTVGIVIAINTYYIAAAIRHAAEVTHTGVFELSQLTEHLHQETLFGAANVLCALGLIAYSVHTVRGTRRLKNETTFRPTSGQI